MKIAAVVVVYNPNKDIMKNINTYISDIDKLYIIDNTENKNNIELFDNNDKIKYIANLDNLGIAKALNMGAALARKDKFKWLLTMDQDSKFKPNQLEELKKYLINNKDEKIGLISPWHKTKKNDSKPEKEIEEVIEVMTSGNIINLDIHKKIGGFKEWFFIDSVDIEYGMNLNKNGYKVIRLNNIELEHELGNIRIKHILNKKIICTNHNYIRRYYICRNIYYVYDMYHDVFPEYCEFIKNGLKGAARNILVFEKDKYRKLRNMYRGYKDFKKGIKGKYKYKN